LASCGSHKGGKTACRQAKSFLQHFLRPPSHFVGVHLFDFRFVGYVVTECLMHHDGFIQRHNGKRAKSTSPNNGGFRGTRYDFSAPLL
jgi:hypothetical protein